MSDLDYDGLPPFANDENRALDAEIKRMELEVADLEQKQVQSTEALAVLESHMVNVRQELVNTQQLVDAKVKTQIHPHPLFQPQPRPNQTNHNHNHLNKNQNNKTKINNFNKIFSLKKKKNYKNFRRGRSSPRTT
jgi:hypothetical protein